MSEASIKLKINLEPEMDASKQQEVLNQVDQIRKKYSSTVGELAFSQDLNDESVQKKVEALSSISAPIHEVNDEISNAIRNLGTVFSGVTRDMSANLKIAFNEPVAILQRQLSFIAETHNNTKDWTTKTINDVAGAQAYATDYAKRINQMASLFQGTGSRKSIGSVDSTFFQYFDKLKTAYLTGIDEMQHKGALPQKASTISSRILSTDASKIYSSTLDEILGNISKQEKQAYTKFMTSAALPFYLAGGSVSKKTDYIKNPDAATPYGHLPEDYRKIYLQANASHRKNGSIPTVKVSSKQAEKMVSDETYAAIQAMAEQDKTGVLNELAISAGLVDRTGHKLTWRNRGSEPQIGHFAASLPVELEKIKRGGMQYREDSLDTDRWNKRSVVLDKAIQQVSELGVKPQLVENPTKASTAQFSGKEAYMKAFGFPKSYIIPKTSLDQNGNLIYREPSPEEIRVPKGQKAGVETKDQKFVSTSDSAMMRMLRQTAIKKGYTVDEELGYYKDQSGKMFPLMSKVPLTELWDSARGADGWLPEGGYEAINDRTKKGISHIAKAIEKGTKYNNKPYSFGFLNQDDTFFIPTELIDAYEEEAKAAGVISAFQAGNAKGLMGLGSREALVKQINNVKSFNTPSHGEEEYYPIRTESSGGKGVNAQYMNWTALSKIYEAYTGKPMGKESILDSLAFVTPGGLFDESFQGRAAGPVLKFAAVLGNIPETLKKSGIISKASGFGNAGVLNVPSAALNPENEQEMLDLFRYYYGGKQMHTKNGLMDTKPMSDTERTAFEQKWLFNAADSNIGMFFADTSVKDDLKSRYLPIENYKTQLIKYLRDSGKSSEEAAKIADAQILARQNEMSLTNDKTMAEDGYIRLNAEEFKRNMDTSIAFHGGIASVREAGAFETSKGYMPVSMAQSLNLPYSAYAQSIKNYEKMFENWKDPGWVQRHGFADMPEYQREMEKDPSFMNKNEGARTYIQSQINNIREHMQKGQLALDVPAYSSLAGMTTGMALDFLSELTGNKVDTTSDVAPLFKSALLDMYKDMADKETDATKKAEYEEIYDEIKQDKFFIAPGLKKNDSEGLYKAVAERYPAAIGTAVAGRNLYYNPDGTVNKQIAQALSASGASNDVFYLPSQAMYKMNTGDYDGDTVWAYASVADDWLKGVEDVDTRMVQARKLLAERKKAQEDSMTQEQKEAIKLTFGEEVLRASYLDTYSKGAMGLGSAVIRNALQLPDGPEKDAAILEGVEYYDLATSEIKKKGVTNAKLGKAGFSSLLVGQNFDRLMKNVYAYSNADDESKSEMNFPSIFKSNIGSINDMTSIGTILMNQATSRAAGGSFALRKKMSDYIKHNYEMGTDLGRAAEWYGKIRVGDLTGEHFVTPEDISEGYNWLTKVKAEQSTQSVAGQKVYAGHIKALETALKFMESDMSTSQENIEREIAAGKDPNGVIGELTDRAKALDRMNKNQGYGISDKIYEVLEEEKQKEIESKKAVDELQKDERFKEIAKTFVNDPNDPQNFPKRYSVTATEPWFDRSALPLTGDPILNATEERLSNKYITSSKTGDTIRAKNQWGTSIKYDDESTFGSYKRRVETQADEIMGETDSIDIVLGNYMHKAFENFWKDRLGKQEWADYNKEYGTEVSPLFGGMRNYLANAVQNEFMSLISGDKTFEEGQTFESHIKNLGYNLKKNEYGMYQVEPIPDISRSLANETKMQDKAERINEKLFSMQRQYNNAGEIVEEGALGQLATYLYGKASKNFRVVGLEGSIYDENGKEIHAESDDRTKYELANNRVVSTHAKPDAVFEIDGQYYILDYKSSKSGAKDSITQSLLYQKQYEDRAKKAHEENDTASPFYQFGETDENGNFISKFGGVLGFNAAGKTVIKYSNAHEQWNGKDFIEVLEDQYKAAIQRKQEDLEQGHYSAGQLELIRRQDNELAKYAMENGLLVSDIRKGDEEIARAKNIYRNRINDSGYQAMSSAETDFFIARYAQDKEKLDEIEKTLGSEKSKLWRKNNPYGSSYDRFAGIQEEIDSVLGNENLSRMIEIYKDNPEIEGDIRKQIARKTSILSSLNNIRSEFAVEDVRDSKQNIMSMLYGVDYKKGGQGLISLKQQLNRARSTKEGLLSNPDLFNAATGEFRTEDDTKVNPKNYTSDVARETEKTRAALAQNAKEKYAQATEEYNELLSLVNNVGIDKMVNADREEGQKQLAEILGKPLDLGSIDNFFENKVNALIGYVKQKEANIEKLTTMINQPGTSVSDQIAAQREIQDNEAQKDEALKYLKDPKQFAELIKEKSGVNGSKNSTLSKINKTYEEQVREAQQILGLFLNDKETLMKLGLEPNVQNNPSGKFSPYDNDIVELRQKSERSSAEEVKLSKLIAQRRLYFNSFGSMIPDLPTEIDQYAPGKVSLANIGPLSQEQVKTIQQQQDDARAQYDKSIQYWDLWKSQNEQYATDAKRIQELSVESLVGKGNVTELNKLKKIQQARSVRENIAEQKDENGQYILSEDERAKIRTIASDSAIEKYINEQIESDNTVSRAKTMIEGTRIADLYDRANGVLGQGITQEQQDQMQAAYGATVTKLGLHEQLQKLESIENKTSQEQALYDILSKYDTREETLARLSPEEQQKRLDAVRELENQNLEDITNKRNEMYDLHAQRMSYADFRSKEAQIQRDRQYAQQNRQAWGGSHSRFVNAYLRQEDTRMNLEAQKRAADQGIKDTQAKINRLTEQRSAFKEGSDKYIEKTSEINEATKQLKDYTKASEDAQQQMQNFGPGANLMRAGLASVNDTMGMLLKRFGRQMFMKAINEAKQFVKQYDKTMTEIQMITLKSDSEMGQVSDSIIGKAKELKVSVGEVSQSAATLYRQGLSDQEVEDRLGVISKFSKVSGTKVADATKLITVAMNTGLVSDAMEASDIVTALGDNAATNAQQIEKGIEKAGAAAAADGTTFGQLAAMLTAITSTTQIGGNVAGRTLNTIFGRMNKIGTNELITDENGNQISGSAVAKLLAKQGIKMYDENGNKQSSFDTLYALSKRWDSMSDAEQQQMANAIAGTRQYSNFAAIMQGMSEGNVDEYMNLIGESSGITDKKFEVYTKSLEASLNDLKNTFDSVVNDLADKGVIENIVGGIQDIITGIGSLISQAGGLEGIVTIFGALAAIMSVITGNVGALAAIAGIGVSFLVGSNINKNQFDLNTKNLEYDRKITTDLETKLAQAKQLNESKDAISKENEEKRDNILSEIGESLINSLSPVEAAALGLTNAFTSAEEQINAYNKALEEKRKNDDKDEFRKKNLDQSKEHKLDSIVESKYNSSNGKTWTDDNKLLSSVLIELGTYTDKTSGKSYIAYNDNVEQYISELFNGSAGMYTLDNNKSMISRWISEGKFIQGYKKEGNEYIPIPYTNEDEFYSDMVTKPKDLNGNYRKFFELMQLSDAVEDNITSEKENATSILRSTYADRLKSSLSSYGFLDSETTDLIVDSFISNAMQGVTGEIYKSNDINPEVAKTANIPQRIIQEAEAQLYNMVDFFTAEDPLKAFQNYVVNSKIKDEDFINKNNLTGMSEQQMRDNTRKILFPESVSEEPSETSIETLGDIVDGITLSSKDLKYKNDYTKLLRRARLYRTASSLGASSGTDFQAMIEGSGDTKLIEIWQDLNRNGGQYQYSDLINHLEKTVYGGTKTETKNKLLNTSYSLSDMRSKLTSMQSSENGSESLYETIASATGLDVNWVRNNYKDAVKEYGKTIKDAENQYQADIKNRIEQDYNISGTEKVSDKTIADINKEYEKYGVEVSRNKKTGKLDYTFKDTGTAVTHADLRDYSPKYTNKELAAVANKVKGLSWDQAIAQIDAGNLTEEELSALQQYSPDLVKYMKLSEAQIKSGEGQKLLRQAEDQIALDQIDTSTVGGMLTYMQTKYAQEHRVGLAANTAYENFANFGVISSANDIAKAMNATDVQTWLDLISSSEDLNKAFEDLGITVSEDGTKLDLSGIDDSEQGIASAVAYLSKILAGASKDYNDKYVTNQEKYELASSYTGGESGKEEYSEIVGSTLAQKKASGLTFSDLETYYETSKLNNYYNGINGLTQENKIAGMEMILPHLNPTQSGGIDSEWLKSVDPAVLNEFTSGYEELINDLKSSNPQVAANAWKKLNEEFDSTKTANLLKWKKGADESAKSLSNLKKGGKDTAQAMAALRKSSTQLNDAGYAIKQARTASGGGALSAQTISDLIGITGDDANTVKKMTKEELNKYLDDVQGALDEQYVTDFVNPIQTRLQQLAESNPAELAMAIKPEMVVDGQLDGDEITQIANELKDEALQRLAAAAGPIGTYAIEIVKSMLSATAIGKFLTGNASGTVTGGDTRRGGGGGGGGGKKKSALDKLLEKQARKIAKLQHKQNMNQIAENKYDYLNDYGAQNQNYDDQIATEEALRKQHEENIKKLKKQLKKTKDEEERKKIKEQIEKEEEEAAKNETNIYEIKKKQHLTMPEERMTNRQKPLEHERSMLDILASRGEITGNYAAYAASTRDDMTKIRQKQAMNNEDINEWKKELDQVEQGSDLWIEIRDKIYAKEQENAQLENEWLQKQNDLIEKRLQDIAKNLQQRTQAAQHNYNVSDIWGSFYETASYRKTYEGTIREKQKSNETLLAQNQAAKAEAEATMEEALKNEQWDQYYEAAAAVDEYDEAIQRVLVDQLSLNSALNQSHIEAIAETFNDATAGVTAAGDRLSNFANNALERKDYRAYFEATDRYQEGLRQKEAAANDRLKAAITERERILNDPKATPEDIRLADAEVENAANEVAGARLEAERIARERQKAQVDQVAEQQEWETTNYDNNKQRLGYQISQYQNSGELTNYGRALEKQNEMSKARVKTLEQEKLRLIELQESVKGNAEEEKRVAELRIKNQQAIDAENNEIEKNTKLLEENSKKILQTLKTLEDAVDKEIEAQKKRDKEILASKVSLQDKILSVLKKRFQDEWDLEKKNLEKQKEALSEYKKLINDRFNYRKKASQQADKDEEIAEYKRQLALIEADPTRSKDAKELRRKIEQMEKERGWTIAEDELAAENERIDNQAEAINKYVQYGEETLKEFLSDANNFAVKIADVMEGTFDEAYDRIINFFKQTDEAFIKSLPYAQQQTVESLTDLVKKAKDVIDTNYPQIVDDDLFGFLYNDVLDENGNLTGEKVLKSYEELLNGKTTININGTEEELSYRKAFIELYKSLPGNTAYRKASEEHNLNTMQLLETEYGEYFDKVLNSVKDDFSFIEDRYDVSGVVSSIESLKDNIFQVELTNTQQDIDNKLAEQEEAKRREEEEAKRKEEEERRRKEEEELASLTVVSLPGTAHTLPPTQTGQSGAASNTVSNGSLTYTNGDKLKPIENVTIQEDNHPDNTQAGSLSGGGSSGSSGSGSGSGIASVRYVDSSASYHTKITTYNDGRTTSTQEAHNYKESARCVCGHTQYTIPSVHPSVPDGGTNHEMTRAYASGGLVDYTGPAWVDGTKTKPEAFLDATDTENIRAILDIFRLARVRPAMSYYDPASYNNTTNIGDINITINQADLKSDADVSKLAEKVGKAFSKELQKNGLNLSGYSFG